MTRLGALLAAGHSLVGFQPSTGDASTKKIEEIALVVAGSLLLVAVLTRARRMTRSSRSSLYWLSLSLLLSGPVHAEDAEKPPSSADSASVSTEPPSQAEPSLKSGKTALLLSSLGTAVPLAASLPFIWESSGTSLAHTAAVVGVGAVVIGPSLGHFYAGSSGRAFGGIGIRALAGAGVAVALLGDGAEGGATSGQTALGVAGVIVGTASAILDIASAPHSAHVHNDRARQGLTLTDVRLTGDSHGIGLRATVAF